MGSAWVTGEGWGRVVHHQIPAPRRAIPTSARPATRPPPMPAATTVRVVTWLASRLWVASVRLSSCTGSGCGSAGEGTDPERQLLMREEMLSVISGSTRFRKPASS